MSGTSITVIYVSDCTQCSVYIILQKCIDTIYSLYTCEFEPRSWWGVLDATTLCDKVCQWLAICLGFFPPYTPVSSTNITDIILKVALKTINITIFSLNSIWQVWLQYLLAMQKLAVAAQEKAKEEKRNFVNGGHVKAVSHVTKFSFQIK